MICFERNTTELYKINDENKKYKRRADSIKSKEQVQEVQITTKMSNSDLIAPAALYMWLVYIHELKDKWDSVE